LNCMPRNWVQAPMRNLEKFIWGRISQARQSSGRHTPISEFTFGTYGLVILDADADLKRPLFLCKKELLHKPIKQYLKQPKN
jgi:hypothetical protein